MKKIITKITKIGFLLCDSANSYLVERLASEKPSNIINSYVTQETDPKTHQFNTIYSQSRTVYSKYLVCVFVESTCCCRAKINDAHSKANDVLLCKCNFFFIINVKRHTENHAHAHANSCMNVCYELSNFLALT